jgi:hypothetical protein
MKIKSGVISMFNRCCLFYVQTSNRKEYNEFIYRLNFTKNFTPFA